MGNRTFPVIGCGVVGLSVLAAGLPGSASAQESASARTTVEEIVVTAQKRREKLQDVPLSMTAVTGQQLERLGADAFTDYARTVPGLSFIDRGPGRNKITLRGVSTGTDMNAQSPVGVYFDEMPVSSPSNDPDLRLFDIERVEVLRGPQGTLYGAGSMGGTIKVITNKPNVREIQAKANAVFSTTDGGSESYRVNGMINVPVVQDKFALRVVGYSRYEGGYIDNIQLNKKDVNSDRTYGGRVAGKLVVNDQFDVLATAFFQRTRLGGTQEANPALGDLKQQRAVDEIRVDNFEQYNLTLNYDFGWAQAVSSTSYFNRRPDEVRDITAFLRIGAPVTLNTGFPTRRISQEVRLSSPQGGKFEWIVGGFYLDQKDGLVQSAPLGVPASTFLLLSRINRGNDQKALFGELSYNFTDRLKATVGLRWFDVGQEFALNSSGPIVGGTRIDGGKSSENSANPKFLLSYKVQDGILLYGQAAQGFRVGGVNNTLPVDPVTRQAAPTQYNSDSLWNYEIGIKTELLDKRLVLNAAAFYIDWSEIQVTIPRADGFSFVGNAGQASSKGVELELQAQVARGFDVSGAMSYTDAQLEKDAPGLGGRKGDRIPAVPRLTFSAQARYQAPLFDGIDGYVQGDVQYVGNSYNNFNRATSDEQPSYALANLKVGALKANWEANLFVTNLFDKRAFLFVDTTYGDKRVNVNRPRTIGISLTGAF